MVMRVVSMVLGMLVVGGCASKLPLTKDSMTQLNIQQSTATRYQFFTSHELKLVAIDDVTDTKVVDGTVIKKASITNNVVVVPTQTLVTIEEVTPEYVAVTAGGGSRFLFAPVSTGNYVNVVEEEKGLKSKVKLLVTDDTDTTTRSIYVDAAKNGWLCLDTKSAIPFEGKTYKALGSTCLNYEENKNVKRENVRRVLGGSKAQDGDSPLQRQATPAVAPKKEATADEPGDATKGTKVPAKVKKK